MPVPTSAVEVAVSMDVSYMLYLSLQILLTAQTCATLPITTTSFPTSTTDTSTGTTHSSTSIDATSTSNTSPITTTPFPTNSGADTTCNSFFFSIMANVSESIHPVNATVASSADVDTPGNDAPITNSPSPTMSGDNSMGNTFSTPSPADTHATCTNTLSPMTYYSFFYKSVCC